MDGTVEELYRWLTAASTVGGPVEIFDELAQRLEKAGMELHRGSASLMTKHPDVYGKQLIWVRGEGARAVLRSHSVMASAMYKESPVAYVRREKKAIRARLEGPAEALEYDLFRELKSAGATDYVIFPMPFRSGLHSFVSWSTSRPGGFTDEELESLEDIVPALSLRWELESTSYALETLLSTYLGGNAARHVLDGEFKRSTGVPIEAVLWATDMRGFTAMVDRAPVDEVLQTLDEYFSCVARPVSQHGGEVLKFIGDAVLAVFPVEAGGAKGACEAAISASDDAFAALDKVNAARKARGVKPLDFGLALHLGEVIYGNIGIEGRLDFTVIGHTVNEACRIESLSKEIGLPLLVTETFAKASESDRTRPVGERQLEGLSSPIEIFALDSAKTT